MLKIQLFAMARQLAGSPHVEIPWVNGLTVFRLKELLAENNPALLPLLPRLLIAVNNNYADDQTNIAQTDEVACFLPVSGG